jgi:alkanesulfonate monooxygenase
MEIELNWCAPVSGDGARLGLPAWERPPSLDYVVSIFEAAGRHGFRFVLLGTGFDNHVLEGWTLASAVLARTTDIGAMVAVRPGFFSAPVLAKMAGTLDTISGGRLSLNVVSGGRVHEQAMFGDYLDHDARYRRTREFVEVCRRLWTSDAPFDFDGEFHRLRRTFLEGKPWTQGGPLVYFGGASPIAEIVGAEIADTYLLWGETLRQTEERLRRMRFLAAQGGRLDHVRFGVRINVITRDTEDEAREAARYLVSPIADERRRRVRQRDLAKTERDSVGQKRQWQLLAEADDELFVEPLLWAGVSVARSGAGMTLVGSHDQVAGRLVDYARLGASVFVLSGYPHLEECERVGREIAPRVRAATASMR